SGIVCKAARFEVRVAMASSPDQSMRGHERQVGAITRHSRKPRHSRQLRAAIISWRGHDADRAREQYRYFQSARNIPRAAKLEIVAARMRASTGNSVRQPGERSHIMHGDRHMRLPIALYAAIVALAGSLLMLPEVAQSQSTAQPDTS